MGLHLEKEVKTLTIILITLYLLALIFYDSVIRLKMFKVTTFGLTRMYLRN